MKLPKSVEQALILNARNGNILWADIISKKLENVKVAYKTFSDGKKTHIGYQFVQHRLVAEGYMTKATATIMHACVVSREIIRITLMIATLNDLEVKLGDILNA